MITPQERSQNMKFQTLSLKQQSLTLLSLTLGASLLATNPAMAVKKVIETKDTYLAPHRAVYELTLKDTDSRSNIADAHGRMVFEISGSKCEGYLVNMRFILSIANTKGAVNVTDVRTSSWEGGKAERFRFNTSQYFNQKFSKSTIGDAARKTKGTGLNVQIESPKKEAVKFSEKAYFPTEHTKLMLQGAIEGKSVVQAPIYDGSENGNTLYDTTAIIGKEIKADSSIDKSKVKNISVLKDMASWPVAISFFDKKKSKKQDHTPDYEIAFRLYKNGVSRDLLIDYGDFSLDGAMSHLEMLPENKCN